MKKIIMLVTSLFLIAGCANNQQGGMATGAVLGGVLGSQVGSGSGRVAATVVGAVIGGLIGGKVGESMDRQDHYNANRALETTRTGQTSTWKNPDTGNVYTVKPTNTYRGHNNQYCREYVTTARVAGKRQQVYGTACRQRDGTWKTVN